MSVHANHLQNVSYKSIITKVTTTQFHIRQIQLTHDQNVSGYYLNK